MDRVRGLVDTGGILLPSPIRRINTEHLVFAPDAFFIAIVRMIIHLSASHTTKGVSESVLLTKCVFRIKKQPTIIIRLNIRYIYLMKRPVHRHFTSLFRLRAHAESRHCSVTRSMPLLRVRVRL